MGNSFGRNGIQTPCIVRPDRIFSSHHQGHRGAAIPAKIGDLTQVFKSLQLYDDDVFSVRKIDKSEVTVIVAERPGKKCAALFEDNFHSSLRLSRWHQDLSSNAVGALRRDCE